MHLELTAKQRALVVSVEAFATEFFGKVDGDVEYFNALSKRGWSAPGWPRPWGGGLPLEEAYLVERTLALTGAPMLAASTLDQAGPLLLALADETLCDRYLPAMSCGRTRWAMHGSLLGAAPLSGEFRSGEVQVHAQQSLIWGGFEATDIAVLLAEGADMALAVADLADGSMAANQPLDPDTVFLERLRFEVLASTRTHLNLAEVLAGIGKSAAGPSCRTGRLRRQFDLLAEDVEATVALAALGVTLTGLEGMEHRAVFNADSELKEAVAIRGGELGRALANLAVDRLGYYALPAPEPIRQHNELPVSTQAARDAMAELIRYLEDDFGMQRNGLAQRLGIDLDMDLGKEGD